MKRFAGTALAAAALFLIFSCSTAPAKGAVGAPAPEAVSATAAPVEAVPVVEETVAAPAAAGEAAAPNTAVLDFLKPFEAAAPDCFAALEKAAILASEGKWLSAYQTMDEFDKANADPFSLAMKTSIVLRGAVRSDMNLSFGLVDLDEGQDLDSLRKGEGDYPPLAFDPPSLAEALAGGGAAVPAILSKELGDYYYDVLGRFSGQWAISDEDILAKIAEEYSRAYEAGVFDAPSLMNYAESLVRLNRGDESDPVYSRAIELYPGSGNLFYSYAMSLSYRGKKAEALDIIDKAIAAYGKEAALVNAIVLGAQTAAELGDEAREESYFAIADKTYGGTPTPGILRHVVAIDTGNKAAAAAAADALAASFGGNPGVVRTIVSTWFSAGDVPAAKDFLQRSIATSGTDILLNGHKVFLRRLTGALILLAAIALIVFGPSH